MTMLRTMITGAALLGGAMLVSTGSAGAQEGVLMRDLFGTLGIIDAEQPRIEYRERAPLVLPPKMELRNPVDPNAVEARAPNWPQDPDVLAERRARAEARRPVTESERRRLNADNARSSIQEIRAGRRPGAEVTERPQYRYGDGNRDDNWVRPEVLRSQGRLTDEGRSGMASAGFERQRLTEPPTAYGRPAAGAPMRNSYEPIDRSDEANPQGYIVEQARRR